jgi:hypothetical protein
LKTIFQRPKDHLVAENMSACRLQTDTQLGLDHSDQSPIGNHCSGSLKQLDPPEQPTIALPPLARHTF